MPHMIAQANELVSDVTHLVAHCQVCGVQWQVRSHDRADAKGCSFCDAPANAITVVSEKAGYGTATTPTSGGSSGLSRNVGGRPRFG